jgi:hypothetical protein
MLCNYSLLRTFRSPTLLSLWFAENVPSQSSELRTGSAISFTVPRSSSVTWIVAYGTRGHRCSNSNVFYHPLWGGTLALTALLPANYFYSSNFCVLTDQKSRFRKVYSIFWHLIHENDCTRRQYRLAWGLNFSAWNKSEISTQWSLRYKRQIHCCTS